MNKPLFKTTIVIWSDFNPKDQLEIDDLARDAMSGDSYCSTSQTVEVADPANDKDWDGTDFFGEDDDEPSAEIDPISEQRGEHDV